MYSKFKNIKLNDKILITGANGFIGKHLIKFLKNRDIVCITSKSLKNKNGIKFIKLNLFNKKKVEETIKKEKPKILIHLAWETEPKKYINKKSNLKWYHSSLNLYYQFCKYGGKKAILVGSGIELSLKDKKIKEQSGNILNHDNLNYYNLTKILFHINSTKISNQFKSNLIWARVFFLYGPGENKTRLIPSIIKSIKFNKTLKISDPYKELNILHVYDVAKILSKLIYSKNLKLVNIANNKNYSIKSIIKKITSIIGNEKSSKIIYSKNVKKIISNKVEINNLKKINYKYKFDISSGLENYINYLLK